MASRKERLAVIIGQEKFGIPGVEDRKGNEHDVKELESTLKKLGFSVRPFKNLNKQEILSVLKNITVENFKNLECILVTVLTHGDSGGVLLAKGPKGLEYFYTKDVWGPFREKFNDIPKIFIFQACRGTKTEETFRSRSPKELPQNCVESQTVPVLPHRPGFLLVHSTIEDHLSQRNQDTGTVFIQTLCNELSAAHNKSGEINFLSLLTEVNNKVTTSAVQSDGGQTSTFTSFLHQPLILKTKEAAYENRTTSQVSYDAAGGLVKTSYENKGSMLILILYTKKYEDQFKNLDTVLKSSPFTIKSILVKDIEVINGLSRCTDFKNVGSLTVFVLAEIFEVEMITGYCEQLYVNFSTFEIQLNAVWSQFTVSPCYELMGKPKLFFFCDLLDRKDHLEEGTYGNIENVAPIINNHSDFLWAYCYGKGMFEELKFALCNSREEITHLLTTAMCKSDATARGTDGGRISHFESTLKLQFYYRSPPQEIAILPNENVATKERIQTEPVASSSKSTHYVVETEPLQLLVSEGTGGWKLDEESLRSVVCKKDVRDRKVVVLSVGGKFRRGKFYLMIFILHYLNKKRAKDWLDDYSPDVLKRFKWLRDMDQITKGILIWPEAFIVGDYAVILLDTEESSDPEIVTLQNMFIFSLSTLVSSIQVLSLQQCFELDVLAPLKSFVEYGKRFAEECDNVKVFQTLLMLIGDWNCPETFEFGFTGGDKLWEKHLDTNKDIIAPVEECFENVKCFLLPSPEAKLEKDIHFRIETQDIEPCFLENTKKLVEEIFDGKNLVPKRFGLNCITAKDLVPIVSSLVYKLQHPDTRPENLLEVTLQIQFAKLQEVAVKNYTRYLEGKLTSDASAHIKELHDEAVNHAKTSIKDEKFVGTTQSNFLPLLENRLKEEYEKKAQSLHNAELTSTLENAKRNFEFEMYDCLLSDNTFHKFHEVNKESRVTPKTEFSLVTGYIEPQFMGFKITDNSLLTSAQSKDDYDNLLREFNSYADEVYSKLLPTFETKMKEKLEYEKNEATALYREEMKNVSNDAKNSKKFGRNKLGEAHSKAEKLAKNYMQKNTQMLKKFDETKASSEELNKNISEIYEDIQKQREEELRVLLEKGKSNGMMGYIAMMRDCLRTRGYRRDMENSPLTDKGPRRRAMMDVFHYVELDQTDPLYIEYIREIEMEMDEKMERMKYIDLLTGKARLIEMCKQDYIDSIERHHIEGNYVTDLESKHEKAKEGRSIKYFRNHVKEHYADLNSEEVEDEAKEAIENEFKTLITINDARRTRCFDLIYSKFEAKMNIAMRSLRENIHRSWQRNFEVNFNELANKCLQETVTKVEGTEGYIVILTKSKMFVQYTSKQLELLNNQKKKDEMKRAETSVQEAIQWYKLNMNLKEREFSLCPLDESHKFIERFHEQAKSKAFEIYRNVISQLSIDVPSTLEESLEKGVEDHRMFLIIC